MRQIPAAVALVVAATLIAGCDGGRHAASSAGRSRVAPSQPASSDSSGSSPAPASILIPDTAASATAAARAILRSVPLPPGSRSLHNVDAALRGTELELSSLEANASGVWHVDATLSDAVDFARSHPAPGFTPNCTCGAATVKWIDFYSEGPRRAINYVIESSGSGVAIGITTIVPWVPDRPAWSFVPESVTSVDVTVQRIREAGSVGGAPTVHGTLVADAMNRLRTIANRLQPEAQSNCIGPVILIATTDILVFHVPGHTITFTMAARNCPQFTVETAGNKPTYLEVGGLDTALLDALGLPPNYGH